MLDWGLFGLASHTPSPGAQGLAWLNRTHSLNPAGGSFRMARSLGSRDPAGSDGIRRYGDAAGFGRIAIRRDAVG